MYSLPFFSYIAREGVEMAEGSRSTAPSMSERQQASAVCVVFFGVPSEFLKKLRTGELACEVVGSSAWIPTSIPGALRGNFHAPVAFSYNDSLGEGAMWIY